MSLVKRCMSRVVYAKANAIDDDGIANVQKSGIGSNQALVS